MEAVKYLLVAENGRKIYVFFLDQKPKMKRLVFLFWEHFVNSLFSSPRRMHNVTLMLHCIPKCDVLLIRWEEEGK